MAGFRLFNYNKEGPGVAKDAPKKRAAVVFFEIYFRKFWNLFHVNLLFLVMNLPIVTRGLADVGLCKITRNYAREKHAFVREDFYETVRRNFKQALIVGIINLLITAVFVFNIFYYFTELFPWIFGLFGMDVSQVEPRALGLMDYAVLTATMLGYTIFTWMKYYIPMMVVTFKLTTKQVYKNAFAFAIAGMPRNVLVSIILIALYAIPTAVVLFNFSIPTIAFALILCALFLPSFRSLLIQYTIFPLVKKLMIDPYYEKNPDADKQLRRDLNLEVDETANEQEEALFNDTLPQSVPENTVPTQYSESELRRFTRATADDEDDDTI